VTPLGISWLVVQFLSQLCHCLPLKIHTVVDLAKKIILSAPRKKVKLIFCNICSRWTIPGHGKGDERSNNDEDAGRTGKQRYSFL